MRPAAITPCKYRAETHFNYASSRRKWVKGPVAIQSAAIFAPGDSLGVLTISNSLTLGGVTVFELKKAPLTNDAVRGLTSVTYGGRLIVTNLGGTITAGDTFPLFQAASFSGNFAAFDLPPLNAGLAWNTNGLTNGILAVMSTVPPQGTNILRLGDGILQLTGVGMAGVNYQLLAATNLASPVPWVLLTNAAADGLGAFQFTDSQATNSALRFYRVVGP